MQVTPFLNLAVEGDVAELSIVGDIGYNFWADTYEDYKKNTSENIAAELNAIKGLKAKTINVTLESLGGDLSHALAIYSLLKNSESEVKVYLRGANASSSTIIACSADSVENIYMDATGLYLIHKPMTYAEGNANDMKSAAKDLDKWQKGLEQAYIGIGVEQEVLDKLMERNGGHGEWLTFAEAKEYGFVGNEWGVKKVSNYKKPDFTNRGLLTPNIINEKPKEMANEKTATDFTEEQKESLWNWIVNKQEHEAKIKANADELEALKAENESLKAQLEEATKVTEETTEEVVEEVVEVVEEPSVAELIENKVKEAIKNLVEPTPTKETQAPRNRKLAVWEQHLENFKTFNK